MNFQASAKTPKHDRPHLKEHDSQNTIQINVVTEFLAKLQYDTVERLTQ